MVFSGLHETLQAITLLVNIGLIYFGGSSKREGIRSGSMARALHKKKLPSLMDVAKASNVSTATVSRCLNEPDKVAQPTLDKVLKCVEELRYLPNFGARAIAANRTGIYGAIIPTMENAIFAQGIEAFQKTIVENQSTMLVASSAYDETQENRLIRTMVARGADGLLLIGTERTQATYDFLAERNIPIVIAWSQAHQSRLSSVGFDNRQAAKELALRAIQLKHRSFAYISAPRAMNDRARDRVIGTMDALAEAGFNPNAMPVIEVDYSIDNGKAALKEILTMEQRPSVVMCGNDVLAVGAVQAAQEAGLRVPEDISITGFDDIELASVVTPKLTTVRVPHQAMGRRAAEVLVKLVKDESDVTQVTLDVAIVERASLAEC